MVNDWPFGTPIVQDSPIGPVGIEPVDTPDGLVEDHEIDAQEAAHVLGVTVNNLRQIVWKKQLAVVKREGRRTFYSLNEVRRLGIKRATS